MSTEARVDLWGRHTGRHQMSMNGKRDDFEMDDLITFGRFASLKPRQSRVLIDRVIDTVRKWPDFAKAANIEKDSINRIARSHRTSLATS